ncbi:hypothetical protein FCL40_07300 [Ferrimonas sediminicola]|uniref:Glycine cleavage system transcriptional repressor n=1 Tax=Ferrimonas sediminicola TaxID=2569538 RepID=A0A4U1BFF0_9GAMM|nr:ACT domain-containing protein [Ferrimonas sediminicola]TKB49948.1 hypothetical protein FCL40_07300 [Ferrimonas sediminicola]
MKTRTIVTVTGADRSGLLNLLAKLTRQLDGVWTASKVIHMGGQVAIMLDITLPDSNIKELQERFEAVHRLHCIFNDPPQEEEHNHTLALHVDADDRVGLIRDITNAIQEMDINITSFDSVRLAAADLGRTVFTASLELSAPSHIDARVLVKKIEDLEGNIRAEAA